MSVLVASIFKNESSGIREWVEHYYYRGVSHIVLLNDDSTDEWYAEIKDYHKKGFITLFDVGDIPREPGRQSRIYNEILPNMASQFDWIGLFDVDEYVWNTKELSLEKALECRQEFLIPIYSDTYGCNEYIEQPFKIVDSFTKRADRQEKIIMNLNSKFKCFAKPDHIEKYHFHIHTTKEHLHMRILDLSSESFRLNHYKFQSLERWKNVVVNRGSADCTPRGGDRKTQKFFDRNSKLANRIEDLGLIEQNRIHGL